MKSENDVDYKLLKYITKGKFYNGDLFSLKRVVFCLVSVFNWLCLFSKCIFSNPTPIARHIHCSEFENKYTNIAKVENDMGITCILWIHIHACFKERCENKQNQLGGQVHKIHLNVLSISAIGNNSFNISDRQQLPYMSG